MNWILKDVNFIDSGSITVTKHQQQRERESTQYKLISLTNRYEVKQVGKLFSWTSVYQLTKIFTSQFRLNIAWLNLHSIEETPRQIRFGEVLYQRIIVP